MKDILAMLAVAALAVAVWVGFDRFQAKERLLLEEQARAQLGEIRESVAKSLVEQQPLTALEDPPLLWQASLAALPHDAGANLILVSSRTPRDSGYWAYDRESQRVYIDCTHTDSSGKQWASY